MPTARVGLSRGRHSSVNAAFLTVVFTNGKPGFRTRHFGQFRELQMRQESLFVNGRRKEGLLEDDI